jgi:hypothetical protein
MQVSSAVQELPPKADTSVAVSPSVQSNPLYVDGSKSTREPPNDPDVGKSTVRRVPTLEWEDFVRTEKSSSRMPSRTTEQEPFETTSTAVFSMLQIIPYYSADTFRYKETRSQHNLVHRRYAMRLMVGSDQGVVTCMHWC